MRLVASVKTMVLFSRSGNYHVTARDGVEGAFNKKGNLSRKIYVKLKFIVSVLINLVKMAVPVGFCIFNLKIKFAYMWHLKLCDCSAMQIASPHMTIIPYFMPKIQEII